MAPRPATSRKRDVAGCGLAPASANRVQPAVMFAMRAICRQFSISRHAIDNRLGRGRNDQRAGG